MATRLSRGKRWAAAVAAASTALDAVSTAVTDLESAIDDLKDIQSEFQEWKDNLPENLQSSPLGEKLDTVCSIDLDGATVEVEHIQNVIDEADNADLPLGFGRD